MDWERSERDGPGEPLDRHNWRKNAETFAVMRPGVLRWLPGWATGRWLGLVVLLLSWLWLAAAVRAALVDAPTHAVVPTYARVEVWLKSAECAQARRVPLVVCGPDGRLVPIEDASPADDRGQALVADLLALARSARVTRLTLTRVNLLMNGAALVVLSVALFQAGLPITAALATWAGIPWGIPAPVPGPDAPGTFFAAYCLALTPVVWIGRASRPGISRLGRASGLVVIWLALTWAILLREPIGMAGLGCSIILLLGLALRRPFAWRSMVRAAILSAVLLLTTQATSTLLTARGLLYGVPRGSLLADHGLAHNLYIGLGTHPNPWGITWADDAAARAVAEVDPSVPYVSPEYFRTLWHLYWQRVRADPGAVLRIYRAKAAETLVFDGVGWKLLIGLAGLAAVWALAGKALSPRPAAIAGIAMTALATLVQGVLAIPWESLFYPATFGATLVLLAVAECAVRVTWGWLGELVPRLAARRGGA